MDRGEEERLREGGDGVGNCREVNYRFVGNFSASYAVSSGRKKTWGPANDGA